MCKNFPPDGPIFGQKWVPVLGTDLVPKTGTHDLNHKSVPKTGYQNGSRNWAPKCMKKTYFCEAKNAGPSPVKPPREEDPHASEQRGESRFPSPAERLDTSTRLARQRHRNTRHKLQAVILNASVTLRGETPSGQDSALCTSLPPPIQHALGSYICVFRSFGFRPQRAQTGIWHHPYFGDAAVRTLVWKSLCGRNGWKGHCQAPASFPRPASSTSWYVFSTRLARA